MNLLVTEDSLVIPPQWTQTPFGIFLTFGWGMDKMKKINFSLKIGRIDATTCNTGGQK
jgi:hypothetical protein